jgi:hypothetical protein
MVINISNLIGTLLVVGPEVDQEKIEAEVRKALLSALSQSVQNSELDLDKCERPEHDPKNPDQDFPA